MDLHERFEKFNDDNLAFEKVVNKKSKRPDLHAFIILEKFSNNEWGLVASAERDEIWLDINDDDIKNITDGQILELRRCGVRHDKKIGCLKMFV